MAIKTERMQIHFLNDILVVYKVAKFCINEFLRQYSWKEYPHTQSNCKKIKMLEKEAW